MGWPFRRLEAVSKGKPAAGLAGVFCLPDHGGDWLCLAWPCALGATLWYRKRLGTDRLFLNVAALSWPAGFLAIISGWMVTEIGRQPWIATGVLRTADAASPVTAAEVTISLALFVLVYGIVFSTGIYYINRLISAGPSPVIVHEVRACRHGLCRAPPTRRSRRLEAAPRRQGEQGAG